MKRRQWMQRELFDAMMSLPADERRALLCLMRAMVSVRSADLLSAWASEVANTLPHMLHVVFNSDMATRRAA
jgi:hypothetical protein